MSEKITTINHGLEEWAEKLRLLPGGLAIAKTFSEDKVSTYARLDQLGLPHYLSVAGSTHEFMSNPHSFSQNFEHLYTI